MQKRVWRREKASESSAQELTEAGQDSKYLHSVQESADKASLSIDDTGVDVLWFIGMKPRAREVSKCLAGLSLGDLALNPVQPLLMTHRLIESCTGRTYAGPVHSDLYGKQGQGVGFSVNAAVNGPANATSFA
ncbi:hypothetical protein H671_1g1777 [Cricetulus griseus]|uniref:Uncharacterized protein n=1 Tax=Cricetulus griseus TaxID=10029 RepID=A0A061IR13_CRIGR|nr:hypothetical protein H671_1g1777 [Cricetulus griseus]